MNEEREKNLAKIRELGENVRQGGSLTHEMFIDFTDNYEEHYKGLIVVHRPTMKDYMKMGAIKAQYIRSFMGDMPVEPLYLDPEIITLAQMIATFKVVVNKCPEWFLKPEELTSFDVIYHVYGEYQAWLNSFRGQGTNKPEGNSGTEQREDAVVDQEVL